MTQAQLPRLSLLEPIRFATPQNLTEGFHMAAPDAAGNLQPISSARDLDGVNRIASHLLTPLVRADYFPLGQAGWAADIARKERGKESGPGFDARRFLPSGADMIVRAFGSQDVNRITLEGGSLHQPSDWPGLNFSHDVLVRTSDENPRNGVANLQGLTFTIPVNMGKALFKGLVGVDGGIPEIFRGFDALFLGLAFASRVAIDRRFDLEVTGASAEELAQLQQKFWVNGSRRSLSHLLSRGWGVRMHAGAHALVRFNEAYSAKERWRVHVEEVPARKLAKLNGLTVLDVNTFQAASSSASPGNPVLGWPHTVRQERGEDNLVVKYDDSTRRLTVRQSVKPGRAFSPAIAWLYRRFVEILGIPV